MKTLRRAAVAVIILQVVWSLALPCPPVFAQSTQYKRAIELANAKDFDRAYDLAVKIVSADPLSQEGYVLKIALAAMLKKTGPEDRQNLMRVAKGQLPIGGNIEADVEKMIALLSGTPTVEPKETVTVSAYVRRKLALIIGVGAFKDSKISPLRFSAADAHAFGDILKNECKFDDVKILINEAATRYNVLTEMNRLAAIATSEDLVVIYVASHGSPENMDVAGVNYIVTYDTEVDNLYPTAYKMDDLLNDIRRRISAERVIAFIDTCYSGATFKERPRDWSASSRGLQVLPYGPRSDAIQEELRRGGRGPMVSPSSPGERKVKQSVGRVIIAASRQDEKSWESDQFQHGFFTYFLILALKQTGMVSVEDMFKSVSTQVPKAVLSYSNAKQNPTMAKSVNTPVEIYLKDQITGDSGSRSNKKQRP